MHIESYSVSDKGLIRDKNEDSYLEKWIDNKNGKGLLLVVADGMGGHRGGDIASKTVVEIISGFFEKCHGYNYSKALEEAFRKANAEVLKIAKQNPNLEGMGSTCTAILLKQGHAYIAHVGDSRAYLLREGRLHRLTTDHTLGELLKQRGDTSYKRYSHVLTNAIGLKENIEIEILKPFDIKPNDVYIICSDGLTTHVKDSEILNIVAIHKPQKACQLLVDTAKKRGGTDNITILIAKVYDLL